MCLLPVQMGSYPVHKGPQMHLLLLNEHKKLSTKHGLTVSKVHSLSLKYTSARLVGAYWGNPGPPNLPIMTLLAYM